MEYIDKKIYYLTKVDKKIYYLTKEILQLIPPSTKRLALYLSSRTANPEKQPFFSSRTANPEKQPFFVFSIRAIAYSSFPKTSRRRNQAYAMGDEGGSP